MGNNISTPEFTLDENDIYSFISQNPGILLELLEDDFEEDEQKCKRSRRRYRYFTREQWWGTDWGQMLRDDNIRDINTHEGKEFRRRFRVPAPFFLDWLVPECKRVNIFGASKDIIPVEIKLLICLRLLGRGNVIDDIVELSKCSNRSVRFLFKTFVVNFANHFKKEKR